MSKKDKIIMFPQSLNNNTNKGMDGKLIDLEQSRNIKVNDSLLDDICGCIDEIIEDLSIMQEIISEDEAFYESAHEVSDIIELLQPFLEEIKSIYDNSDKKVIFKLKIILEQSNYIEDLIDRVFESERINVAFIPFYRTVITFYIKYVRLVLEKDDYDYDDFKKEIDKHNAYVEEVIYSLSLIHTKTNMANLLVEECKKRKEFKNLSTLHKQELSNLINHTIDRCYTFDEDFFLKCFNEMLNIYIDNGIFNVNSKEEIKSIKKKIYNKLNICFKFYYIFDLLDNCKYTFDEKFSDINDYCLVSNNIKETLVNIKKIYQSSDNNCIGYICTIVGFIVNMIIEKDEDGALEKDVPLNDKVISHTFLEVFNYLLDYSNQVLDGKNPTKKRFATIWKKSKIKSINNLLYDVYRRDIFENNNELFYHDKKNKKLMEKVINKLSVFSAYVDYDYQDESIIKEFKIILSTIKVCYYASYYAKILGLDIIAKDIEELNFFDFNNYSILTKYVAMVNSIFSDLDYEPLIEFLNTSSFSGNEVSYNDKIYICLYYNEDECLIMDDNGYYIVNKKDIKCISSDIDISSINYQDKEYTYSQITESILRKYQKKDKQLTKK